MVESRSRLLNLNASITLWDMIIHRLCGCYDVYVHERVGFFFGYYVRRSGVQVSRHFCTKVMFIATQSAWRWTPIGFLFPMRCVARCLTKLSQHLEKARKLSFNAKVSNPRRRLRPPRFRRLSGFVKCSWNHRAVENRLRKWLEFYSNVAFLLFLFISVKK